MMYRPFISVIIPTRHRNETLAACLAKVAPGTQVLPPEQYEVIVTDDGSTTTAEAMVAARFPWVRWTAGPRRGPAANRNHGASVARGEWLAFTDDDCLPATTWLRAFASRLQVGRDELLDVLEGSTICSLGLRSPLEHAPINLTGGHLWSCNMLVRKSVFIACAGFDERFPHPHMEDIDFRERLRRLDATSIFVADAVVDHPPRRLDFGWKLARHQESAVYYWYKLGNVRRPIWRILTEVAKTRVRFLRRGTSHERAWAMLSLFCELLYLIFILPVWDASYRKRHAM